MQWMTETDKRSLVALVTYPELSGKAISERVDITQSSLLRSRKRLMKAGLIRSVKIPSFSKLGFSVFFSGFGVVKEEETDRDAPVGTDDIFFMASEKDKGFGLGASGTYSDFYRLLIDFRENFSNIGMESFGFQVMPVDTTHIWRFADFGQLLAHDFGIEIWREDNPNEMLSRGTYDFQKGELEVFRAMIEHPEWSVEQMALKLNSSRQKIYRLDRKFRQEGLYVAKTIPNLKALGYEILNFATWKVPSGRHKKILEQISGKEVPWPIWMVTTPLEGFMVSAFRTFRESRSIGDKMRKMTREMDIQKYIPQVLTLSLQDTDFLVDLDFRGMTHHMDSLIRKG